MPEFVQDSTNLTEPSLWMQQPVETTMAFLPSLLGALTILLIGWIGGVSLGYIVKKVLDRTGIDRAARDTPISSITGMNEKPVSRGFGKATKWFIYLIAILGATNVLAIPILSSWLSAVLTYIPVFVAGVLITVLGFILGDMIGDAIERTRRTTLTSYTSWFADGARILIYFTALVVGLDTIGIDVSLIYIFAEGLAYGLGIGIALAIGIGLGWGSKDYVSEHIEDWMNRAKEET